MGHNALLDFGSRHPLFAQSHAVEHCGWNPDYPPIAFGGARLHSFGMEIGVDCCHPLLGSWRFGLACLCLWNFWMGAIYWIYRWFLAFPLAAVLVGWAAERIQNQRALMGTLCILAGQVLILALGLLWQRSIVPIAEPVWETLARLGPGLLMKTAFGGLVVVTLSRIIERNSKETPTIES